MKVALLLVLICALSGCADHVDFQQAAALEKVGFWYGLWHGLISPFAWFISLFSDSVSVYAIYNNGGWYDVGFLLGVSLVFGGSAKAT